MTRYVGLPNYFVPPKQQPKTPEDALLDNVKNWRSWLAALVADIPEGSLDQDGYYDLRQKINDYVMLDDCQHENKIPVYFLASNGTTRYQLQCTSCFWTGNQIPKSSVPSTVKVEKRVEVDRIQVYKRREQIREEMMGLIEKYRFDANKAFWAFYNRYIQTPEWKERSRMTLERDQYRCLARLSGCLGRASQAHHWTYTHVGNEPLFDLFSVCVPCHEKITEMDRKGRNGNHA